MVEKKAAQSPEEDEQRFIQNMVRMREDRGWSQTELARRMVDAGWENYTQMTVSRTEKHERPLRLGESRSLARIFDRTVNEMLMRGLDNEALDQLQELIDTGLDAQEAVEKTVEVFLLNQQNLRLYAVICQRMETASWSDPEAVENFESLLRIAQELGDVKVSDLVRRAHMAVELERGPSTEEPASGVPAGGPNDGADSYRPYENISDTAMGRHTPGEEHPIYEQEREFEADHGQHQETR